MVLPLAVLAMRQRQAALLTAMAAPARAQQAALRPAQPVMVPVELVVTAGHQQAAAVVVREQSVALVAPAPTAVLVEMALPVQFQVQA